MKMLVVFWETAEGIGFRAAGGKTQAGSTFEVPGLELYLRGGVAQVPRKKRYLFIYTNN